MNATQRKNLAKLADYLAKLPTDYAHFHMAEYFESADGMIEDASANPAPTCGAVACAIGHGPAAGVKAKPTEQFWEDYSKRAFGVEVFDGGAGQWCFSGEWSGVDNTPHGAAARIRLFLDSGLPADWREQMYGLEPRSYEVAA